MHSEILTQEQLDLLPLVKKFSSQFYLVGGTAVALQLGHRRSIDFDLFTFKKFHNKQIKHIIDTKGVRIDKVNVDEDGQFTLILKKVQFTFFHYPFHISADQSFRDIVKLPSLYTLAAMKAYALGRRAKWKDYVDLYFIIKKHGIGAVIKYAKKNFRNEFNEKLFRSQLCYFKDIDYSEQINYLSGFQVEDEEVKEFLVEMSLQII